MLRLLHGPFHGRLESGFQVLSTANSEGGGARLDLFPPTIDENFRLLDGSPVATILGMKM